MSSQLTRLVGMGRLDIDVVDAADTAGIERARAIRRAVFVGEFAITDAEEFDDLDTAEETVHAIATLDGADAGTARLVIDPARANVVHITRVAVLTPARRSGVGRALMEALEEIALNRSATERSATRDPTAVRIELSVMVTAAEFYRSLGYTIDPATYLEVRIPHQAAFKDLGSFPR